MSAPAPLAANNPHDQQQELKLTTSKQSIQALEYQDENEVTSIFSELGRVQTAKKYWMVSPIQQLVKYTSDDVGCLLLHDIGTCRMYGWFPDQDTWVHHRQQRFHQSVRCVYWYIRRVGLMIRNGH